MAKILAVDDEPAILEMIESILNKDGHLVTKVSNIKRGFTIEGVIKFIDNRRRFNLSRISENNNEKLIIQFKNNKKNKQQKKEGRIWRSH